MLRIYFPDGVSPEEFSEMLETLIDIDESLGFGQGLVTIH